MFDRVVVVLVGLFVFVVFSLAALIVVFCCLFVFARKC